MELSEIKRKWDTDDWREMDRKQLRCLFRNLEHTKRHFDEYLKENINNNSISYKTGKLLLAVEDAFEICLMQLQTMCDEKEE